MERRHSCGTGRGSGATHLGSNPPIHHLTSCVALTKKPHLSLSLSSLLCKLGRTLLLASWGSGIDERKCLSSTRAVKQWLLMLVLIARGFLRKNQQDLVPGRMRLGGDGGWGDSGPGA